MQIYRRKSTLILYNFLLFSTFLQCFGTQNNSNDKTKKHKSNECRFPESEIEPFFLELDISKTPAESIILDTVVEPNNAKLELADIRSNNLPNMDFSENFEIASQPSTGQFLLVTTASIRLPTYPSIVNETLIYITIECNGRHYPLITIRITEGENRFSPVFYNEPYDITIPKNSVLGSQYSTKIIALDLDPYDGYGIRFAVQSGGYGELSVIAEQRKNADNFVFETLPPDYPHERHLWSPKQLPHIVYVRVLARLTRSIYYLNVSAMDNGIPPKRAFTQLKVNIKSSNELIAKFTQVKYFVNFTKADNVGTDLIPSQQILAEFPGDLTGEVEYAFGSTALSATEFFALDPVTARLRVRRKLATADARDLPDSFTIPIEAYLREQPKKKIYSELLFNDVSEVRLAYFTQCHYETHLLENPSTYTKVLQFNFKGDLDGVDLLNGTDLFEVNSNGIMFVKFGVDIDREKVKKIVVQARIRSSNTKALEQARSAGLCQLATVEILIDDFNEYTPRFDHSNYRFYIELLPYNNTDVGTVHATDEDKGEFGRVRYRILDNSYEMVPFKLFQADGLATIYYTIKRRFTLPERSYTFTIEAYDANEDARTSRVSVQVILESEAEVRERQRVEAEQLSIVTTTLPSSTHFAVTLATDDDAFHLNAFQDTTTGKLQLIDSIISMRKTTKYNEKDPKRRIHHSKRLEIDENIDPVKSIEIEQTESLGPDEVTFPTLKISTIESASSNALTKPNRFYLPKCAVKLVTSRIEEIEFIPLPRTVFISSTKPVGISVLKVSIRLRYETALHDVHVVYEFDAPNDFDFFEMRADQLIVRRILEPGEFDARIRAHVLHANKSVVLEHALHIVVMRNREKYPVFERLNYEIQIDSNAQFPIYVPSFNATLLTGRMQYSIFVSKSNLFDWNNNAIFIDIITGELTIFEEILCFNDKTPMFMDESSTSENAVIEKFFVVRAKNIDFPRFYSDVSVRLVIFDHRDRFEERENISRVVNKIAPTIITTSNFEIEMEESSSNNQSKFTFETILTTAPSFTFNASIANQPNSNLELTASFESNISESISISEPNSTFVSNITFDSSNSTDEPNSMLESSNFISELDYNTTSSYSTLMLNSNYTFESNSNLELNSTSTQPISNFEASFQDSNIEDEKITVATTDIKTPATTGTAINKIGTKTTTTIATMATTMATTIDDVRLHFPTQLYTAVLPEGNYGTRGALVNLRPYSLRRGMPPGVIFLMKTRNATVVPFFVRNTTGELIALAEIDRERVETYQFTVLATSKEGETAETVVKITILDVNDNFPRFLNSSLPRAIGIDARIPVGATLAHFYVEDADAGAFGRVTFRIEHVDGGGDVRSMLNIDAESGELKLARSLTTADLSYDTFFVTIEAMDSGRPALKATHMLRIEIFSEETRYAPRFKHRVYDAPAFNDELTRDAFVAQVLAAATPLHYFIIEQSSDLFRVDETGTVRLTRLPMDTERGRNYAFNVTAVASNETNSSDLGSWIIVNVFIEAKSFTTNFTITTDTTLYASALSPTGLISSRDAAIIRRDTCDFAAQIFNAEIRENTPGRHRLLALGTRGDCVSRRNVRFAIHQGASAEDFELNPISGELFVLKPLDREKKGLYLIIMNITFDEDADGFVENKEDKTLDNDDQQLRNEARRRRQAQAIKPIVEYARKKLTAQQALVAVYVLDENDNAPIFTGLNSEGIYAFSVDAHIPLLVPFARIQATDADVKQTEQLIYALSAAFSGSEFFAINTSTGSVAAQRDLTDLDSDMASLEVTVSDGLHTSRVPMKIYIIRPGPNAVVLTLEREVDTLDVSRLAANLTRALNIETRVLVVQTFVDEQHRADATRSHAVVYALECGTRSPLAGDRLKNLLNDRLFGINSTFNSKELVGLEHITNITVPFVPSRLPFQLSLVEIAFYSFGGIIAILTCLLVFLFLQWCKMKQMTAKSDMEYMVDSEFAGPRPYNVELITRKMAQNILANRKLPDPLEEVTLSPESRATMIISSAIGQPSSGMENGSSFNANRMADRKSNQNSCFEHSSSESLIHSDTQDSRSRPNANLSDSLPNGSSVTTDKSPPRRRPSPIGIESTMA